MVAVWKIVAKVLFGLIVAITIYEDDTLVEGRRGGGFRGFRSSFRSSRSRYSRRNLNVRRSSSGVYWKSAAAIGTIYGLSRYKSRRRYYSNPDRSPTICENHFDYQNNGSYYTKFICPKYGQPEDYTYCCGEYNRQHCCRFADNPGRVAGSVIGGLLFFGIIGIVIYCCCCRKRGQKGTTWSAIRKSPASQPPVAYQAQPPPPQQPGMMAPTYPQPPAGGAYPPPGGAPGYPPQPQGAPGYPPQPQGGAPGYPAQPLPPQPGIGFGEKPGPYPPETGPYPAAMPPPPAYPGPPPAGGYAPGQPAPYPPQ